MADSPVSLAMQEIKEKMAALNFATDAVLLLLDRKQIDPALADLRLRRLSARRTDLRDKRMTMILTGTVTDAPNPHQIQDLRDRVTALYNWNVAAGAIEDLVDEAIAIATS